MERFLRWLTLELFGPKRGVFKILRRLFAHPIFRWADKRYERQDRHFPSMLPQAQGALPEGGGDSLILFAVADAVYVQRYASMLMESLRRNSPATASHLHIIGDSPQVLDHASSLTKRFPDLAFSFTWESRDFSGWHEREIARYCQCIRFFRASELLRKTARPLLVIDVDGIVMRALPPASEIAEDADVALIMRPEFSDPSKFILASAVYLAPTESGLRFIEAASRQMVAHLLGPVFTPKLDQRCLAAAYSRFRESARIRPLSRRFASTKPENAIIFTGKGELKKDRIFQLWADINEGRDRKSRERAE